MYVPEPDYDKIYEAYEEEVKRVTHWADMAIMGLLAKVPEHLDCGSRGDRCGDYVIRSEDGYETWIWVDYCVDDVEDVVSKGNTSVWFNLEINLGFDLPEGVTMGIMQKALSAWSYSQGDLYAMYHRYVKWHQTYYTSNMRAWKIPQTWEEWTDRYADRTDRQVRNIHIGDGDWPHIEAKDLVKGQSVTLDFGTSIKIPVEYDYDLVTDILRKNMDRRYRELKAMIVHMKNKLSAEGIKWE